MNIVNYTHVILLGSHGNIGSSLTKNLKDQGYNVYEVENRNHIDLRKENALDIFNDKNIAFLAPMVEINIYNFLCAPLL